jgi:hypothetical protein
MTNQNDGASTGGEPVTGAPPIIKTEPENPVPSKPATEADLEQVKNQMSGFERSTLGWTRASFIVILATGIFIALQWREMHAGGQDTHDLAVAAGKQADAAGKQLDEMKKQVTDTHDLAVAAQDQAKAAKKTADTAHDTLTRSNRPWVGVESVRITQPIRFIKAGDEKNPAYFVDGSLEIVIKNFGSSPALSVDTFIEAYDPSFSKEKFDPKSHLLDCGSLERVLALWRAEMSSLKKVPKCSAGPSSRPKESPTTAESPDSLRASFRLASLSSW